MPTLVPGAGNWAAFNAVVAGLGKIGSGAYSNETAIARWIDVPYRIVTTTLTIGVSAVHGNGTAPLGITKVDFYLNGGAATSVSTPTKNATTGQPEYACTFDSSSVSDGLSEIRAIVYPVKGFCRVFSGAFDSNTPSRSRGEHSFFVNSNHGGTMTLATYYADSVNGNDANSGTIGSPFQTLYKGIRSLVLAGTRSGGTVYLKAGNYEWPNFAADSYASNTAWCMAEAAGGVSRSSVIINATNADHYQGFGSRLQGIRGLTLYDKTVGQATDTPGHEASAFWQDNCDVYSSSESGFAGPVNSEFTLGVFRTGGKIHDMNTATGQYDRHVVGVEIYNIGEDSLRDLQGFVCGNLIHDTRQIPPGHADLDQHFRGLGDNNEFENCLYLGNIATRIGIVGEGVQGPFWRNNNDVLVHKDIAYVNNVFGYAGNSQILHDITHFVIWHCGFLPNAATATGGVFLMQDDPGVGNWGNVTITSPSFRCTYFDSFSINCTGGPTIGDTSWGDNNHCRAGVVPGTNPTNGSTLVALFNNPNSENYSPKPSGPLTGRTASKLVPFDVVGTARAASSGAIGPYEEDSVPTNPPVLTDITRNISVGVPFLATIPNSGDLVDTVAIVDPTHAPAWLTASVVAGVVTLSGTPT